MSTTDTKQTAASAGAVDPITFEVIRHKLWSINEEGSQTMTHVSGSPVVHATDYNFGIYAADGEMAVIGVYLLVPIYTGSMAIREFLNRFDDIREGDVFIVNDPFIAAEHQNDVQFCAPFFHDGELIAWIGCMAHQVDLGGMDAGSWCPTATDVFQEGITIPPGRIVREGKVNQELWDIVIANSRMPFVVSNDFTAFLAGLKVSGERLTELCDRYGGDTVKAVMGQSIDGSERGLRELLTSLPDGTFEHTSYLDRPVSAGASENELVTINCKLTKAGDELTFDYDGSDEQSAAYGMATRAGTVGAVATLMLCLFGSELQWNHGLMRPITVKARDGLCVTAQSPMPVSGGAAGANWVAMSAAAGCIAKMVSFSDEYKGLAFGPGDGSWQLGQFGGLNQYGEPFAAMYMDSLLWGGPAFADRDGVDSGGAMVILGGGTQDVEQHEVGQPLLYLWRREVADSGGAGRNRGGNGIEFALVPYDTDEVSGVLATHGTSLPNRTGIFGGYPGSVARYEMVSDVDALTELSAGRAITELEQAGGNHVILPGVTSGAIIKRGEIVNVRLQNGGGYGDPLDREPARVLRDLLDGAVTTATGRDIYGVVLDGDAVDEAATTARREQLRDERRAAMVAPTGDDGSRAEIAAGAWGDSLRFVGTGDASRVHCAHCDHELGRAGADWRALTGTVALRPEQASPLISVHDELVVHQHICPSCAASLWVDVVPKDGPLWRDFTLERPGSTVAS